MFSVDVRILSGPVRDYFELVGKRHCPFLLPAIKRGKLFFSEFVLPEGCTNPAEEIFYLGIIHTEYLRVKRWREPDSVNRSLICENVAVSGLAGTEARQILAWAHWLLKLVYLEAEVIFGKFWVGEEDTDRNGNSIQSPIFDFISIRSLIKPKDRRFLDDRKELLAGMEAAEDDGRCCAEKAGLDNASLKVWRGMAKRLASDSVPPSERQILSWLAEMREHQIYSKIKAWAESAHPLD
jgi:hypothetical protein